MLEVRDLRVVYPNGFEALRSVSLRVREGEIVALTGRSGAGKSTLLRCLNGMQRPTSGQILLDETRKLNVGLGISDSRLEFRIEAFNLLNRSNFGSPNGNRSATDFGTIRSLSTTPRQIQLGAKVYF